MAEGARLESVFRLTPNEGSNPSLSASLNEKGPRKSVGLFHLIRRVRIWFEPLVRQIRRELIWTRFSAARRASTMDGAGNPPARKSGPFSFKPEIEDLVRTLWFDKFAGSVSGSVHWPDRGQDAQNNPEALLSRIKPGAYETWQSLSRSQFVSRP